MQRTAKYLAALLAAGVAVIIAGGAGAGPAVSPTADDQELTGETRDRAADAALRATGGGTVTETEMGDDGAAYGVEVLVSEGREVEVNLDRNMNVTGQEADDDGDEELTGSIRDQVVAAALKATGGGTVTDTEMDDGGAGYEVEVLMSDGREVEVNLDRNMNVTGQETDD
ncbi:MAG: PepSY domain-containing protein [Acidimicrobiia bacterium]